MSTRSITHIHEMQSIGETVVCSFYRHWDGYPSEHGNNLATWLKNKRLVNGFSSGFDEKTMFNRAGTMSVQLMSHIQSISGCEAIPTGSGGMGEEYTYHIYFRDNDFYIQVDDDEPVKCSEFKAE